MSTLPRTTDGRRFGRITRAARALALGGSVSLLACEQSDRVDTPPRDAEPTPTRIGEPSGSTERDRPADPDPMGTRTSPMGSPGGDAPGQAQQGSPMNDEAPMGGGSARTQGQMQGQMMQGQMQGQMHGQDSGVTEKTAQGDVESFERRFEDELGQQDLTLAASFDVPDEPTMRMFVVAKKEPSGEAPSAASGGATATPPGSATTATKQGTGRENAQAALETTRLVVAYSDEATPDRVTIAYMQPKGAPAMGPDSPDAKLFAAIDRAAGEQAQQGSPPPAGQGQPASPPSPTEPDERRG